MTRELQTVKKDGPIRTFFSAAEGYRFVIADYSQFEVRVLTGLSKDKAALDIFKNGKDFFSEVARIGFNVGQNGKSLRKIVKPIVHGYHNGRGLYSIHDSLQKEGIDISLDAALLRMAGQKRSGCIPERVCGNSPWQTIERFEHNGPQISIQFPNPGDSIRWIQIGPYSP